jgi:S1-C subfamily serine protease
MQIRTVRLLASLVFSLSSCFATGQNNPSIQKIAGTDLPAKIRALRPSVVEILVGGKRSGSGFIISTKGHIMTATHVIGTPYLTAQHKLDVNYSPDIEVVFSDGSKVSAHPLTNIGELAALYDSAILKVDRITTNPLALSRKSPDDGQTVILMGFPLDLPNAVTYTGVVASHYPLQAAIHSNGQVVNKQMIQVEAPIAKGFSGSALVDYDTNEVVGIIEIKIGGINDNLQHVAQQIQEAQASGVQMTMMGIDPNASLLNVIGVLDAYLSAGSGSAVSVEHIYGAVQAELARKIQ